MTSPSGRWNHRRPTAPTPISDELPDSHGLGTPIGKSPTSYSVPPTREFGDIWVDASIPISHTVSQDCTDSGQVLRQRLCALGASSTRLGLSETTAMEPQHRLHALVDRPFQPLQTTRFGSEGDEQVGSSRAPKRSFDDHQDSESDILPVSSTRTLLDQEFSCPFRKRNPTRFNVRDHQHCAVQSFPDICQLKHHVKIFHKQKVIGPLHCLRCKLDMRTSEDFQKHLAEPNSEICQFREKHKSSDPEDGIDARVEDLLSGREKDMRIDSWIKVWRILFPEDNAAAIPSSEFVPVVESHENISFLERNHTITDS
ncbi:hypothetical protein QBC47DRAFT_445 [Echria macrotheca]|uniref:C2H2-type domain-containing protein n=1 Tax=Echria macrotheca TaxID=438768 RepID=A0AAJ0FFN5_9PEZI|nr:hypothetical protein QBC47DRAFT_445 [Echria macrotheca]